jgi:hypothetical protein
MRDLPDAIAMMVQHTQVNFERNTKCGKVTPEWEADYHSLMSLFALAQIAWNETVEDSASWHIIKDHIAARWTLYTQTHPVDFTKSEHIELFAELNPEEAHDWSAQQIADHLTKQGIDVRRHQVWRVLHKPGH